MTPASLFCRRAACLALTTSVALVVASFVASAQADIFILRNGGQVRGEWVNRDEQPRQNYVVRTPEGATVTLDASQVKIVPQSAAVLEYEKIRPTFADTAEDQWKLSEWCRLKEVEKGRQAALERILELDPNHRPARAALGYMQRDGHWVLPEQARQNDGYVRYKGKWLLPQEIRIYERKQKDEESTRQWFKQLKTWREWLGKPSKAEAAVAEIRTIRDPNAVPALAQALQSETDRATRQLFVDALGRIGGPATVSTLVEHTLNDEDREIRYACLQQLVSNPQHEAVERFVVALKSKDNTTINRAGNALGQLKDRSAIAPLIEGLVTTHKFVETTDPNQIAAGFTPTGGGSFSAGSSTKVFTRQIENQLVLDGLVAITGDVNFGFDKRAWRTWWSTQVKQPAAIDTRRD